MIWTQRMAEAGKVSCPEPVSDRRRCNVNISKWKLAALTASLVLAVAAASFLAVKSRRESERARQAHIESVVAAGENPRLIAPVAELARQLGPRRGTDFVRRVSAQYDAFLFDGSTRFCQIHRGGMRYSARQDDSSDAVILTAIGSSEEQPPSVMWYGPSGFRIADVRFSKQGVHVAAESPAPNERETIRSEHVIAWKRGEAPQSGIFSVEHNRSPETPKPDLPSKQTDGNRQKLAP